MDKSGPFETMLEFNGSNEVFKLVLEEHRESLATYKYTSNIVLISIYGPLILISFIANLLLILVILRYRSLKSVTNIYLVSLSFSDLLVTLICMPTAIVKASYSLWLFGEISCKITHYLTGVAVGSSVFTLTAMSIDRYLAIRYPKSNKMSDRSTFYVVGAIWLTALAMFTPLIYVRKLGGYEFLTENFYYCVEVWPSNLTRNFLGTFYFIFIYAIPGLVIVLAYSLMGLRLCAKDFLQTGGSKAADGLEISSKNVNLPGYDGEATGGPSSHGIFTETISSQQNLQKNQKTTKSSLKLFSGQRLIRERRRVAKILLVIALGFGLCWSPYSALSLVLDLSPRKKSTAPLGVLGSSGGSKEGVGFTIADLLPFAMLFGHFNSLLNPTLYFLLSSSARRCLGNMLRHPCKKSPKTRRNCQIRINFKDPSKSEGGDTADQIQVQGRSQPDLQVQKTSRQKTHREPRGIILREKINRRKNTNLQGQGPSLSCRAEYLNESMMPNYDDRHFNIPSTIREESSNGHRV